MHDYLTRGSLSMSPFKMSIFFGIFKFATGQIPVKNKKYFEFHDNC